MSFLVASPDRVPRVARLYQLECNVGLTDMNAASPLPVTERLAEFAARTRLADIPESARTAAKSAIADSISVMLAGTGEGAVRLIRAHAEADTRPGAATVLGCGTRLSAPGAALANGAAAHALDYDSISLIVSGFVASPVLYAVLALAEEEGSSGAALLEAFSVGWEVEAAIARGLGVAHYAEGWHSTATLGHFGAAVGAGKLLGFDTRKMRYVIGVAASEASGLRTMIGKMTNPYHVAKAARNGVVAARLVGSGFVAHDAVLETEWGFCNAFNGKGNYDLARMVEGLGDPYDLDDPGLVIKIYPCCGLIHSALDGVLDLVCEHRLQAERVRRAVIRVHELVPKTMDCGIPETGYQAKFSAQFCVALALAEGAVRLSHFTDERAQDPKLRALAQRVEMQVHPELKGYDTFLEKEFSDVALTLDDGTILERRVWRIDNRGSRGRPATRGELRDKFAECAARHRDPKAAMAAFDMLLDLERVDDVRTITALLR